MKKTKAKRKLIAEKLLSELHLRWCLDVPPPSLIRQFHLDISRPALVTLLRLYAYCEASRGTDAYEKIRLSLYPPWWDALNDGRVMENPDGWSYEGEFPTGRWVQDEND